ncbi:SH3 domain-containing C40 family peptidase [Paraburkholderia sp. DHOC27]|uniref:SH3 domain-containing C40 family peptidase n=1 Tax=Paraburkholderia sp. DHOC27 TaxID=2303330 RepID=UPI000E3E09CF|nr:SH3 domain-containing C40 family peptidase [Paraburkholderia sp. DHOC27]RFU48983.1 hydrolase [Paraburkholderia sp. DHOC27]
MLFAALLQNQAACPDHSRSQHRRALNASLRVGAAAFCLALAACNSAPSRPASQSDVDPVSLYPMAAYDQNVDHWIAPASSTYDQPFLSAEDQHNHLDSLRARYFGTAANAPSPWNSTFVETRVYSGNGADIAALQRRRIANYDNRDKPDHEIGYGENFRPHTAAWIDAIAQNMDVGQFERTPGYDAARRAIATDNLLVRELPTMDPSYYDHRLAGEGYPFDNLQISAARPGTPLYVLGSSVDGGWFYVQTPDVQGWVRSDKVGMVNASFVDIWRSAARDALGAVIVASAPVRDSQGVFRFDAPAGTLLPLAPSEDKTPVNVMVPARDANGHALVRIAPLTDAQIAAVPLAATPRHLAMLMKTLIGRPYGWGNSGFYNDCSSELQSIFATFGVWLPRHSSTQMSAGQMVDLSSSSPAERLDYLAQHGAPMRTLIYIGGHVMLYLGNTTYDHRIVPLVYQDVWGLRPADNSRRAVIGGSVILPLLVRIPEDPSLQSLAATPIFQISIIGSPSAGTPVQPDDDNPAS